MNYLLFQPEVLTEKTRVYKDGQLLNNTKEYNATYERIISLFERAGNPNYPWMGKYAGFYVLRGLFNTKDEEGRILPFLYATNSNDVKNEVQEISSKIGHEVASATYQTIESFAKSTKNKRLTIIIAISTIIVILVSLIIILCNH